MIGWSNPLALFGLLAIAGPVIVHLLRRRRAERLFFPSIRFIPDASTSAVRFRMPADPRLLILRMAIVGLAAAALAQPSITWSRSAASTERMTRAVVVDETVAASPEATEAAAAESTGPAEVIRIRGRRLRDGVQAAVEALSNRPRSRAELVLVSDFRHGALRAVDVAAVPAGIGVRFVEVGQPSAVEEFTGATMLGVGDVPARAEAIRATPEGTGVRLVRAGRRSDGLRLETSPAGAEILLRAVARAGAPSPSADEPIALTFAPSAAGPAAPGRMLPAWMVRTALRMRRDPTLIQVVRNHVSAGVKSGLSGIVVAHDASDSPVVVATRRGTELLIQVAAPPEALVSAATLRSALIARAGGPEWNDREVARIPSSTLAGWARPPDAVKRTDVRAPAPGHARAVWGVVLGLLVVEGFVRKPRKENAAQGTYAGAA